MTIIMMMTIGILLKMIITKIGNGDEISAILEDGGDSDDDSD